jgi:hypothetical protein
LVKKPSSGLDLFHRPDRSVSWAASGPQTIDGRPLYYIISLVSIIIHLTNKFYINHSSHVTISKHSVLAVFRKLLPDLHA